MSYAVIIRHLMAERETELCRVETQPAAARIAEELRCHSFVMKDPAQPRGKRVPKYQYVRVEEIA